MREEKLLAKDLLAKAPILRHERERSEAAWDSYHQDRTRGLAQLNRAVRLGEIVAWGRFSDNLHLSKTSKPRQKLPPEFVDELRQIDLHGRPKS